MVHEKWLEYTLGFQTCRVVGNNFYPLDVLRFSRLKNGTVDLSRHQRWATDERR